MSSASVPQEPSPGELLFWQSIKDSNNAADFVSYLNKFPDGFFCDLASNRLMTLRGGVDSVPPESQPSSALASAGSDKASSATSTKTGKETDGLYRLQLVYWLLAALIIAVVTVQSGGDDKISGWERLTNPQIVFWANDRGMPDILTNQYWLPASLTNEQAKERLVAEGKVSRSESVIPLFIYTWRDDVAWSAMLLGTAIAFGIWLVGMLVAWVVSGFRQRA